MTTQVVVDTTSEIVAKLQTLAPEQQQQVLDFIKFLAQKYVISQKVAKQRVMDLFKDQIWMSDNFNDPLPDNFGWAKV